MFDFSDKHAGQYCSPLPMITNLELLPNELIWEILSYASILDLSYSWLNLNRRFNIIIYNLSVEVFYTLPERSQSNQWWDSWKNLSDTIKPLRHFASQVVTLRIDQYFLSDVLNKINITEYSYVRILRLCQLNATQLDAIRPHNFPHLEHLFLMEVDDFSLEILCQFQTLHSCELESLKIDAENSNLSSPIQSMLLGQCHPWNVAMVLRHFPQLVFFKVFIFLSNCFVHRWDPVVNFFHPNLTSLDIYFLDVDSSDNGTGNDKYNPISELLTSISFTKRIRYRFSLVDVIDFNFEQFQHIIRKLEFVQFSCLLMWLSKYRVLPNIDHIRQIPLFNQLKTVHANSKVTLCRTILTKTSISNY